MAPILYELSVSMYIRQLEQLLQVLKKGEEFAKQTGKNADMFVQARMSADMNVRNTLPSPEPLSFPQQLTTLGLEALGLPNPVLHQHRQSHPRAARRRGEREHGGQRDDVCAAVRARAEDRRRAQDGQAGELRGQGGHAGCAQVPVQDARVHGLELPAEVW